MEMVLHQGVGEDEGEVVLLPCRLQLHHDTFFSGGCCLPCLEERALLRPETLGRRPKNLMKVVEVAPRLSATDAGESVVLPRLHFVPLLH